ncbi:MAG: DNA double-strand break repair nuclease NurA [Candidatus Obscuribacterales bacterium]|nr:DNA double-strand break repair nuclease NurA [Candidatus Obscuribacterales bacterium]
MLDFLKLMPLLAELGSDSLQDIKESERLLELALRAFHQASLDQSFADRLDENRPWVLWPLLKPLTELGCFSSVSEESESYIAVGVDGSQIMSSHHEVSTAYLLNAGVAAIDYSGSARLFSEPRLYARPDDLYPLVDRRRVHIDELYVALERSLFELEILFRECLLEKKTGKEKVLALVDGSLLSWSLEKMPVGYQEAYLHKQETIFDNFAAAQIPCIGYISKSRSADLVNALRVSICPYELSHCQAHCAGAGLNEEAFPCSSIWPLSDRLIYSRLLRRGELSSVFASQASVSKLFKAENQICFAYLSGLSEVARLEFPRFVFDDGELFQFALRAVMSQCNKGFGYPVVLSEAHNQAVIRGVERDRFFELIAKRMLGLGVGLSSSPKEQKKRRSFI